MMMMVKRMLPTNATNVMYMQGNKKKYGKKQHNHKQSGERGARAIPRG